VTVTKTSNSLKLAHTDGSRTQHGRKIAVSTDLKTLHQPEVHSPEGLSMWEFPLTLPIPERYNPERDFYPPHEHADLNAQKSQISFVGSIGLIVLLVPLVQREESIKKRWTLPFPSVIVL
jgi:hypothetical protein